jgi:DNA-binding transcriptional MerR regulator
MLYPKQEKLLTSGVFARLSQSTKRTVHWYTNHGLLRPKRVNSKRYRFYSIEQIIDLQVIMLLRQLNFSLPEIKKFLRKNSSAKDLFIQKKNTLLNEFNKLQKKMNDISYYYKNLDAHGVLIHPIISTVPSLEAYSIEKIGPYSKIYDYLFELKYYFSKIPKNSTYFALFPDREYSPRKDRMRIGVVKSPKMTLKKDAKGIVRQEIIPKFKSLNYKHTGSPALISLLIMQMHEYMRKKHIKQNLTLPINELEFYSNSKLNGNMDDNSMISEINIPAL